MNEISDSGLSCLNFWLQSTESQSTIHRYHIAVTIYYFINLYGYYLFLCVLCTGVNHNVTFSYRSFTVIVRFQKEWLLINGLFSVWLLSLSSLINPLIPLLWPLHCISQLCLIGLLLFNHFTMFGLFICGFQHARGPIWSLKSVFTEDDLADQVGMGKVKKVTQSCATLGDPMDYTVRGIFQARILEWVAFPVSRGSSQPRDWTQVSRIAGEFFTSWATVEALAWEVHILIIWLFSEDMLK